jgi:hypothetical protein
MYSWRRRPDTTVVDEPLYAHYLATTGRQHPGYDDIIASQKTNGEQVIEEVILGSYTTPIVFFKQMAKHLIGLDRAFLAQCANVLLTRDPFDMLTSFQANLPDTTLDDTGFVELVELLDQILATGNEPVVLDSKLLLLNPGPVLVELCRRLDVDFDEAMMSWPPGPKPEDGVWATHWYHRVHQSTTWAPWEPKTGGLLPELEPVLEAAIPMYERLRPYCIDADST